jgi:hypothetical protein
MPSYDVVSPSPLAVEVAMRYRIPGFPSFLAAATVALSIVAAGCNALNATPSGSSSAATAVPTETALSSEPVASAESPAVSQPAVTKTNTDWGRIWDALPPSFPVYPGATASTEIGEPASGQFVVPTDVATATTWTKSALDATGLRTTVSGPLEDGSMTLDSTGAGGCAAKTTIARIGSVTTVTVLYGASCPFS